MWAIRPVSCLFCFQNKNDSISRSRVRRASLVRMKPLSPTEIKVARLVAQGKTNAEIADLLGRHEQTIKNCLSGAMRKLGARNRVEFVLRFTQWAAQRKRSAA